jgi:chaperonin GroES
MSSLRPLNDKVLIRRLESEDRTAGGILLPEQAKEKPKQGTVEALGDGKKLEDGTRAGFQVAPGNRVLFSSYAGSEVKVDGDDYLVMGEEDILAIIED